MRKVHCVVVLLAVVLAAPALAETSAEAFLDFMGPQAFTERAPGAVVDRATRIAAENALNAQLAGQAVAAGLERPLAVRVAPDALNHVLESSTTSGRLAVGVNSPADARVDLGQQALAYRKGAAFGALAVRDGFTWTGAVESPGASALRLHLTDVSLPEGVELFVYNGSGEAHGPYRPQNGEIWTHTLVGSRLVLQARYQGADVAGALAGTSFTVAQVGHLTDRFLIGRLGAPRPDGAAERAFCSFNASCVENAGCSSIPGAIAAAEDAIGQMLYASGAYLYICTGGLVADQDSSSQIPYFLTANHCISKGREASSLEVYFNFTTACNGSCYDFQSAGLDSNVGASIVASNRTSDFTLLELNGSAPSGAAFLGWSTTPVANSNNTSLYRISHPGAAPQAYSEHRVDTGRGTCSGWPRGNWIYSVDTYGATEGGSSGSPVLNGSGQIVGQLSGACGFNVNDACDSDSNSTVDGAFAAYFSQVEPFLTGGGGTGGGCTDLGQVGDPCTSGADCCSGSCKGKPGAKTCK